MTEPRPPQGASLNRVVKRWPGWLALGAVAAVLLLIGATRDGGISDPGERADSLARRVACPVCDGESVFDSANRSSINLRNEIRALVNEGRLSDEEILARIQSSFPNDILLVPPNDGVDVLVWALPVAVGVGALGGLVVVFRRWRAAVPHDGPTEEERARVAAALAGATGDDD